MVKLIRGLYLSQRPFFFFCPPFAFFFPHAPTQTHTAIHLSRSLQMTPEEEKAVKEKLEIYLEDKQILTSATTRKLREKLESDLGINLIDHTAFIKKQVDTYLETCLFTNMVKELERIFTKWELPEDRWDRLIEKFEMKYGLDLPKNEDDIEYSMADFCVEIVEEEEAEDRRRAAEEREKQRAVKRGKRVRTGGRRVKRRAGPKLFPFKRILNARLFKKKTRK